jgi:hypothetical protein
MRNDRSVSRTTSAQQFDSSSILRKASEGIASGRTNFISRSFYSCHLSFFEASWQIAERILTVFPSQNVHAYYCRSYLIFISENGIHLLSDKSRSY